MICPDGSVVGRDPANNCEFFPCPDTCINPVTGQPDTLVNCFADPCSVQTCDGDPNATCTANYCGGCHALFTDADGNAVDCDADSDGDGVDDVDDLCPDTAPGRRVNADGCSGRQYVDMECGDVSDYRWGIRYVMCVTRASARAHRHGLLTRQERAALIRRARRAI